MRSKVIYTLFVLPAWGLTPKYDPVEDACIRRCHNDASIHDHPEKAVKCQTDCINGISPKPEQESPLKPEQESPFKPGQESPLKLGQESPLKPGQEYPLKPEQESPLKPDSETDPKPDFEPSNSFNVKAILPSTILAIILTLYAL